VTENREISGKQPLTINNKNAVVNRIENIVDKDYFSDAFNILICILMLTIIG